MIIVLILGLTLRTPISMCVWSLMLLCINVCFAFIVKRNADSRELDNGKLWAVMSFFFSLPVVLLYFIMNFKLGVKPSDKEAKTVQRNAIIMCSVALIISIAITPLFMYEDKQASLQAEYDESSGMAYLNDDGTHYVLYDKMGKVYPYDELYIPLYTKDGKVFMNEGDYYKCGDKVLELSQARVDSEGYFVQVDYDKFEKIVIPEYEYGDYDYYVWKDGRGNYYYDPDDCSWDKDGNLVFRWQELTDFYAKHK